MESETRSALMTLIRERAYRYSPDAPFTLASGATSPFYFDCKAVTLTGRGLGLLGPVLLEEMKSFPEARVVGGLTLGADPLATALALCATAQGRDLDAIVIRKVAKGHGTGKGVEGNVSEGTPAVILDDVVTTGGSTITAIERAAESGLKILGALVLVDRQEFDGVASIEAALEKIGSPREVRAVFRAEEFLRD